MFVKVYKCEITKSRVYKCEITKSSSSKTMANYIVCYNYFISKIRSKVKIKVIYLKCLKKVFLQGTHM